ncbi:MAG: rhodanese-like domain-containing protein [bacterium]
MNFDRSQSGFVTTNGMHNLSPREAAKWCSEGAITLDVREEYVNQYKKFSVPVSIQIPFSQLHQAFQQLPKDKWIIVADSSGMQSKAAYEFLQQNGYTQLSNLAGGMVEWERDGMPLLIEKSEKLTGSCACQLRARDSKKPTMK